MAMPSATACGRLALRCHAFVGCPHTGPSDLADQTGGSLLSSCRSHTSVVGRDYRKRTTAAAPINDDGFWGAETAWATGKPRPIAVLYVARFGARQRPTSATTTPPSEDTVNVGALLARGSSCKTAALNAVSGVIFGAATGGDYLDDKELTCATRTISLKAWRSMRRGG
jgi:hypothetical protein